MKKKRFNIEMIVGSGILGIYCFWSVCWYLYSHFLKGDFLKPYLPISNMKLELIEPFAKDYFFGTDIYGRSIFDIISNGLNYSIAVGLVVSLSCSIIGIVLGYFSVTGKTAIRFVCDIMTNVIFIFPSILIAILVMSFIGQSFWGLILVLVFTGWPAYAKIARGETKRVLGLSYVESARAIGVGKFRMFLRIILPEIFPIILVQIVLGISGVIISEATLGFLGLGGSQYSWGNLISMGKTVLLEAPYIVITISLVMAGLIIGLNLFGDGLRDYLDPKKT